MKNFAMTCGLVAISSAVLVGCDSDENSAQTPPPVPEQKARWVQGDMHVHSTASDGHQLVQSILNIAYKKYDLDFIASTEHSGFKRYEVNEGLWRVRASGERIFNPEPSDEPGDELHSHDYAKDVYADDKVYTPRAQDNNRLYANLVDYRHENLTEKQFLLTGMEYTLPVIKEHTTMVLLDDGDVDEINEFHYLYGEGERWEGDERKQTWDDLLEAMTFLQQNYSERAFLSFNHPSRKHEVMIEYMRELHNTAPDIIIGMEGAPGHQRNPEARGSYEMEHPIFLKEYAEDYQGPAYHGRTYGGFDYMTARMGGVWDALLSEGRRISIFAHSDFHSMAKDFWPGEYSKSHIYLEQETQKGLLDAIKGGQSFVTHGDLISELEFIAQGENDVSNSTRMGGDLVVPAGENVTVSISMNLPEANNNGDKPDLKFVDVIAGYVTGKIDPTDPEFNKPFADDVSVIQSFEKDTQGWAEKDGKLTLSFTLEQVEQDMYIRLRGSNSEKGTPGYVDLEGNPVIDLEKTESDPNVVAWKDLWFYSNPIFITAN